MKKFKIITCINYKNALGNKGELLYHIKNDLENFRRMTINNVVIMGRKTLESLPKGKGLPNRINIVISSDKNYKAENCIVCPSIDDAITLCEQEYQNMDWYVIGGGAIYTQFLERKLVDTIYLTEVIDDTVGDTFFPNFREDESWYCFYQSEAQHNEPPYTFSIWKNSFL